MSKTGFNFALGSRGLTPAETAVVENAKSLLLSSLKQHRKDIEASMVVASNPNAKAASHLEAKKAAAKPAPKASVSGSAAWTSDKVAPAIRKY